ncbi:MAG TPA: oxalurate catabolism protein HpxZ [Solirubrobacteraceae bacterium]|jgi:hypothetical protein|nr:oxalurate catabolism protein HpxZ [Solirubrobacteraceae bacterium]
MTDINKPDVVAEVTSVFERYEQAFRENDLAVLDELFWEDERVVRFGPTETLYGADAVRRFRSGRPADDLDRTLLRTTITTFGETTATTSVEFRRHRSGRQGRQSQTWIRTRDGWRIVAAHVSAVAASPTPDELARASVHVAPNRE